MGEKEQIPGGLIDGGCLLCNQWPHAADCPHEHPGVHRLIGMIAARTHDAEECAKQRDDVAILMGRVAQQIQLMSEVQADTHLAKSGISAIIHLFRLLRVASPNIQNFVTGNFDGKWYMTVQSREGMTPAEHIMNLTNRLTSLENENDRLVQVIEQFQRAHPEAP